MVGGLRVGWRREVDVECVAERHSLAGFRLGDGGLVGGLVEGWMVVIDWGGGGEKIDVPRV